MLCTRLMQFQFIARTCVFLLCLVARGQKTAVLKVSPLRVHCAVLIAAGARKLCNCKVGL